MAALNCTLILIFFTNQSAHQIFLLKLLCNALVISFANANANSRGAEEGRKWDEK